MEKDFDKKIKDILNNAPEFEPTRSDLELMRSKLLGNKNPNNLLWLLPLLFLPFFLGGYFLFAKINTLSDKIVLLEAQETNKTLDEVHLSADTTIHKTVFVYDTVYRKFYKDVYVKNEIKTSENPSQFLSNDNSINSTISTSDWQKMAALLERVALNNGWMKIDKNGNRNFVNEDLASSAFFQKNKENIEESTEKQENFQEIQEKLGAFSMNEILNPSKLAIHKDSWKFPKKTIKEGPIPSPSRINPLMYTIPTGLSFGLSASPIAVSPINGSSKIYAYEFGLSTALHFPKNVRLESGIFMANSKLYTDEDMLIEAFPTVQPDEPGQNLKELKGTLSYLQIPISFSKTFIKKHRTYQPVFGIGITAMKPAFQFLTYEFIDGSGNETYKRENYRAGVFSIANPQISFGFVRPLRSKYQLSLKGFYQRNNSKDVGVIVPKDYFGLRLGLERKVF